MSMKEDRYRETMQYLQQDFRRNLQYLMAISVGMKTVKAAMKPTRDRLVPAAMVGESLWTTRRDRLPGLRLERTTPWWTIFTCWSKG